MLLLTAIIFGLACASPLQRRDDLTKLGPVVRKYETKGSYAVDGTRQKLIDLMWSQAKTLADAVTQFKDNKAYDAVKQNWFGKDWNSIGTDSLKVDYGKRLSDNLARMTKLYGDEWPQANVIVFHDGGPSCARLGSRAYTRIVNGDYGTKTYNIHLCSDFWKLPNMGALNKDHMVMMHKDQQIIAENFENSQGKTLFHETMHFDTVTIPQAADPETYGVKPCWDLAANSGAKATTRNADSYAAYAVALYVQRYFQTTDTMRPRGVGKRHIDDRSADDDLTDQQDIAIAANPADMTAASSLICRGMNDTREWVTYDSLNPLISKFCTDAATQGHLDQNSGAISRTYSTNDNAGPNAVTLSTGWAPGSGFKPDFNACFAAMNSIKDNCNGNDPHNPLNHKWGGSQDNVARYSITPQVARYQPGQCSIMLTETEYFTGDDVAYTVAVDAYDGDGVWVASSGGAKRAGDGNALTIYSYYAPLQITPEKRNDDYIQFTIGSTSFTSKDNSATKPKSFCAQTQQGWNSNDSGKSRVMSCYFPC